MTGINLAVPAEIITIVVGLLAIAGAVYTGVRWGIRQLADEVRKITMQVTPNGGDTNQLGDTVQRIETSLASHVESDQINFEALRTGQTTIAASAAAAAVEAVKAAS